MRKKRIHTRLITATLIAAVVAPLINTTAISALYTVLYSDITVPDAAYEAVGFIYGFINALSSYAAAACLAYAIVTRTHRATVGVVTVLSLPMVYTAVMCVDAAFYGSSVITSGLVLYNAVNCSIELLRLAVAAAVSELVYRSSKRKRLPREIMPFSVKGTLSRAAVLSAAVVFAARLIPNIVETVTLLTDIGAPQNAAEVLTLVTPHIESVIYFVLGYFLCCLIMSLLEGSQAKPLTRKEILDSQGHGN